MEDDLEARIEAALREVANPSPWGEIDAENFAAMARAAAKVAREGGSIRRLVTGAPFRSGAPIT